MKKNPVSRTWSSVRVKIELIDPTPKNYKIKTELGRERLQHSLKEYGLASNVVCSQSGKRYILIDGNSRLEEAKVNGEKLLWVSIPDKPLSPKEFKEMSAMFDFAKAGDVDMERVQKEVLTHKEMYKQWGLEIPMELLETLGANAHKGKVQEYPDEKKKGKAGKITAEINDIRMVNLFFSDKQEAEFRRMEIKLRAKFKTSDTTNTVFKALKSIK